MSRIGRLSAAAVAVAASILALGADAQPTTPRPGGPPPVPDVLQWHSTASGLKYVDITVGQGATPHDGQTAVMHFTGWLADGTQFDSSRDRHTPFGFQLGSGQVVRGWDEGIRGMRVGGIRRLVVPPDLAYGAAGVPGIVPPNATLTFDVELLRIIGN
jgi:FKBP-type peptidyl-prolyl cis-trans isomerase